MEPVTVIGSYLSPYVRKVLVCLAHKRIPYRIDPIVPFFGNAEFSRLSPLRRALTLELLRYRHGRLCRICRLA